jgi:predicted nuclease of predicted toxin-antitoxin system
VKFLIDNQLPMALSRFLVSLGCDCVHVLEIGLAGSSDVEIWRHACQNHRIVITKDEDFLYLADREPKEGGLIWVRLGNLRTPNLIAEFGRIWPQIQALLQAGGRVIELR